MTEYLIVSCCGDACSHTEAWHITFVSKVGITTVCALHPRSSIRESWPHVQRNEAPQSEKPNVLSLSLRVHPCRGVRHVACNDSQRESLSSSSRRSGSAFCEAMPSSQAGKRLDTMGNLALEIPSKQTGASRCENWSKRRSWVANDVQASRSSTGLWELSRVSAKMCYTCEWY